MNMEMVALICWSLAYVTVGFLCYRRKDSPSEDALAELKAEQDRKYKVIMEEIQYLKELK